MRILYVTNGFPYPLTSGYLRHYFLIKELARSHNITLLSVVGANFAAEHAAALRPFTEQVLTFAAAERASVVGRTRRRLQLLTGGLPAVSRMCETVRQLVRAEAFDVVLLSGKQTFPVFASLAHLPVIADLCDATSLGILGRMRVANPVWLPLLLLDYAGMRRVERRLMRNAAHLLFATRRDREALLGSSAGRATIVPNGIDLEFWRRSSKARGANTVIFTGAMDYAPNVDAALYLVDEVLPEIRRAVPDVKALIVGRDPTARLISAGKQPGVTVTGAVEDIRPFLESATVFAAPLRFGAGVQNKILEAMAMSVPVVASPLAAAGLRPESGERPPLQVAHNRQEFAELIRRELSRQADRPAPDATGRQFVQQHYGWASSGEKLEQVIRLVTKRPSFVMAAR